MRDSQVRCIRQQGFPGTQCPVSFYSALLFQPRLIGCVVARHDFTRRLTSNRRRLRSPDRS